MDCVHSKFFRHFAHSYSEVGIVFFVKGGVFIADDTPRATAVAAKGEG